MWSWRGAHRRFQSQRCNCSFSFRLVVFSACHRIVFALNANANNSFCSIFRRIVNAKTMRNTMWIDVLGYMLDVDIAVCVSRATPNTIVNQNNINILDFYCCRKICSIFDVILFSLLDCVRRQMPSFMPDSATQSGFNACITIAKFKCFQVDVMLSKNRRAPTLQEPIQEH